MHISELAQKTIHAALFINAVILCVPAVSSIALDAVISHVKILDANLLSLVFQGKTCKLRLPVVPVAERDSDAKAFIKQFCKDKELTMRTNSASIGAEELIGDLESAEGSSLVKELINAGLATEKTSFLKGAVEREVTTAALRPGNMTQQRSFAQVVVNNQNQLNPLTGTVDDRQSAPLSGRVNDSQVDPLRGKVRSARGSMLIVQSKKFDLTSLPLPASTQQPANRAPEAVATHAPLRSVISDNQRAPVRNIDSLPPTRQNGSSDAPQRTSTLPPLRSTAESAPRRDVLAIGPPIRTLSQYGPPQRSLQADQPIPVREAPNLLTDRPIDNHVGSRLDVSNLDGRTKNAYPIKREAAKRDKPKQSAPIVERQEAREKREQLEALLWDKWYANLNALLCKELERTLDRHGHPAGTNRIRIIVSSNHQVEAHLIQGSNESFNEAVLEAYNALNANPNLRFPKGSARTKVEFESNHIQDIPGPASIDARSVQGDREFIKGN